MITTIFFWGGYTTHCYELTKAMSVLGFKVYIISPTDTVKRNERIPTETSSLVTSILCNNSLDDIERVVNLCPKVETLHINTALKSLSCANHTALKYLLKHGYNVFSLPQESFQLHGLKGKFNALKWFFYLNCTYRRKIKAFGVTGYNAEGMFKRMQVPSSKLFQFLYVTSSVDSSCILKSDSKSVKFIYVGAIDERKNIIPLVDYLMKYPIQDFELSIYGSWTLDSVLNEKIRGIDNIKYYGKRDYAEVRQKMLEADYLILPSLYDGWGAVANEGLQAGCKLIVSKTCGSSIFPMISANLGYIFDAYKLSTLDGILIDVLNKGPLEQWERHGIQSWADQHIHSSVVARYLKEIINVYFSKGEKVQAPWIKNVL